MAELARAVASLRVVGDDLQPDDVSALLGCAPTNAWAKGDTLTSHGASRTARFGMWSLQAEEAEPGDLDAQVAAILSRLTQDETVWAEVGYRYDLDLFCGWFMKYGNEGTTIGPDTMSALGRRGIPLDIDLYGGDSERVPD
ncbi:DUF4279 domain-containing protein [Nocardioides currus]|uniref:DUF4279 domain-containing protein n=1 Tax=Nocardioides currus TaxID=2133958 RepID=A0A2R7YW05_9ACTN|nr:DUF4279 domain-containing protein [Nocardioides currus]PUA80511.1 hypothetical protein C7S10_12100 [Nocardioides currus]